MRLLPTRSRVTVRAVAGVPVLAAVPGLQLLLDAAPDQRFDRAEILFLFEAPVRFEDLGEIDRQGRDGGRCVGAGFLTGLLRGADPVAFGALPRGDGASSDAS